MTDWVSVINLHEAKARTRYSFKDIDSISKDEWNEFWILFNLFQFFEFLETKDTASMSNYSLTNLLEQFDEEYHPILNEIFKRGEVKSEDDEIKLYSLTDRNGKLIAEAELILYKTKQVYSPFSEQDLKVFQKEGFEILTKE